MGMPRRTIPLEIGLDGIMVDARPRGEQIDQPGLFFLIRQRRLHIIDPQLGQRAMDIDEPFADGDAIERAHEALLYGTRDPGRPARVSSSLEGFRARRRIDKEVGRVVNPLGVAFIALFVEPARRLLLRREVGLHPGAGAPDEPA